MQAKSIERDHARKLRMFGKSLGEISRKVHVSKSSVSTWCRDIFLNDGQKARLISRQDAPKLGALANKLKREAQLTVIKNQAAREITKLNPQDLTRLKDIGTILYWAEGTKKGIVDITNSDPQIIRIAMLWLRKVCNVPDHRFRASIFYHSGQKDEDIKQYWSTITGIPLSQFHRSILKKEGTGHRKKILYMGTCKVRVCDKDLLHKILTWIEQFHLPQNLV